MRDPRAFFNTVLAEQRKEGKISGKKMAGRYNITNALRFHIGGLTVKRRFVLLAGAVFFVFCVAGAQTFMDYVSSMKGDTAVVKDFAE